MAKGGGILNSLEVQNELEAAIPALRASATCSAVTQTAELQKKKKKKKKLSETIKFDRRQKN
jgi:hypothetical protein